MMRTSNPALNEKVFEAVPYYGENAMTIMGAVNKTGFLLVLAVLTGSVTWFKAAQDPTSATPWMLIGLFGGFIAALVTIFKKQWAAYTAPLYALLEGLALGGVSAVFETQYKGIVFMAVFLTFGVLGCLLIAYRSGIIKPTQGFIAGVTAATGAIALYYAASIVMGFFGVAVPLIHSSSTFGILFSAAVVVIAALNLVLDFHLIQQGAANGAPKYMEWYCAFGLMLTLVWLYLEILRLLAKLQSRNR
jgi:uncharacterized YccA/Bax inhibitor family protein